MAERKKQKKRIRTKLSNKEQKFVNLVVAGEKDIDAYRESYKSNGNPNTLAKEAFKVRGRPLVIAAIEKGRAELSELAQLTAKDLITELEEARQIGKKDVQPAAMVSATMGKAKLLGLDKVIVEIQNAEELTPWSSVKGGIDK